MSPVPRSQTDPFVPVSRGVGPPPATAAGFFITVVPVFTGPAAGGGLREFTARSRRPGRAAPGCLRGAAWGLRKQPPSFAPDPGLTGPQEVRREGDLQGKGPSFFFLSLF